MASIDINAGVAMRVITTCPPRSSCTMALRVAAVVVIAAVPVSGQQQATGLDEAKRLFYNAQYRPAAAAALEFQPSNSDEELARDELRTSALLFQLRGLLESPKRKKPSKEMALERCGQCGQLIEAFMAAFARGQRAARRRVQASPTDETALFFLGKLDLNYVWLQLGPLHRRTGWNEYWEARRSLDAALKLNPQHVRARVARAWIDYIVDTKMPWGLGWIAGGGDKKRALAALRESAEAETDFFSHVEAVFGLWDMLVRERQVVEAIQVAEQLATVFPDNPEVATFLEARREAR